MSELKQSVKVWKHSEESFIRGLYYYKYHEWTSTHIKEKRNPKSLNKGLVMAIRELHQVSHGKSANIDSQQQAWVNTWKKMNNIAFRSKRNLVDENIILKLEEKAKEYKHGQAHI